MLPSPPSTIDNLSSTSTRVPRFVLLPPILPECSPSQSQNKSPESYSFALNRNIEHFGYALRIVRFFLITGYSAYSYLLLLINSRKFSSLLHASYLEFSSLQQVIIISNFSLLSIFRSSLFKCALNVKLRMQVFS